MKVIAPMAALSVGDVARRSGVAISTVHFYEKNGLIEGWRTAGNQRRYARAVLRRIAVIRIAQRAGIPLKVIAGFFAEIPSRAVISGADWQRLTRLWQELIDERIEALRQLRDEIDSCIGCGCLSLTDCPLRNPADRLSSEGPGARLLAR